jgi:hypothetical protein
MTMTDVSMSMIVNLIYDHVKGYFGEGTMT